jgi:hypothetical protein
LDLLGAFSKSNVDLEPIRSARSFIIIAPKTATSRIPLVARSCCSVSCAPISRDRESVSAPASGDEERRAICFGMVRPYRPS